MSEGREVRGGKGKATHIIKSYLKEARMQYKKNVIHSRGLSAPELRSKLSSGGNRFTSLSEESELGSGSFGTIKTYKSVKVEDDWLEYVVFKSVKIDRRYIDKDGYPEELSEAVLTKFLGDIDVGPPCKNAPRVRTHISENLMNLFVASDADKSHIYIIMDKMSSNMNSYMRNLRRNDFSKVEPMMKRAEAQLEYRINKMLEANILCIDAKSLNVLVDATTPGDEKFYLSDFDSHFCCAFDPTIIETGVVGKTTNETAPCDASKKKEYAIVMQGLLSMSLLNTGKILFKDSFKTLQRMYLYDFLMGSLREMNVYVSSGNPLTEEMLKEKAAIEQKLEDMQRQGFQPPFKIVDDGDYVEVGGAFSSTYNNYGMHFSSTVFNSSTSSPLQAASILRQAEEAISSANRANSNSKNMANKDGFYSQARRSMRKTLKTLEEKKAKQDAMAKARAEAEAAREAERARARARAETETETETEAAVRQEERQRIHREIFGDEDSDIIFGSDSDD